MDAPAMTSAAALARATPVAFATNGTVRDARGLASRTYNTSLTRAYCTFMSPRTPIPRASSSVDSRIRSSSAFESVTGGKHARGVAGVNSRLLDVLHDSRQEQLVAVE